MILQITMLQAPDAMEEFEGAQTVSRLLHMIADAIERGEELPNVITPTGKDSDWVQGVWTVGLEN